jgi:anti-anti-sigma regulatory factor
VRFTTGEFQDPEIINAVGQQLVNVVEEPGRKDLLLNCDKLTYVNSLFVGKLIVVHRKIEKRGGRLATCHLSNDIRYILDRLGLRRLYTSYDTEEIALAELQETIDTSPTLPPEFSLVQDLEVPLNHWAGEFARVTRALAQGQVNIISLAGMARNDHATLRFIPDNVEAARKALAAHNIAFNEGTLFRISAGPGAVSLPDLASRLDKARISIQAVYMLGQSGGVCEFALAVDDVERAQEVLLAR